MSTIGKISQRTGLAVSTVTGILRDARGFSAHTRQRVLQAAEEMEYRPNFLGKALAGGKSMTIGVLGCWLTAPSIAMKLDSIESTARKAGYLCFLASAEFANAPAQVSHLRGLLDRRVDGLVLDYAVVPPPPPVLALLKTSGIPHVFMDWAPADAINRVAVDRRPGYAQAAAHLAKLGHRHVAYITTRFDLRHPEHKLNLYRKRLADVGIRMDAGDRWCVGTRLDQVATAAHALVKRELKAPTRRRPTALILLNDTAALAATRAAADIGVDVPGEISIVGFDDMPFAAMSNPALTTIHQPRAEVGEAAFASLLTLMRDPTTTIDPIDLACRLIPRESTGVALARRLLVKSVRSKRPP